MNFTRTSVIVIVVASVLALGADLALGMKVPARYPLIGFVGCFVLVYWAKYAVAPVIRRPEDYYDQLGPVAQIEPEPGVSHGGVDEDA